MALRVFSLLIVIYLLSAANSFAQNNSAKKTLWEVKLENPKVFIENKGQFNGRNNLPGSEILYAVDNGASQIFFTKTGLTYRFDKKEKNHKRKDGDKSQPKVFFESDLVTMHWENANPDMKIIEEGKTPDYYSYSYYEEHETKNINYIYGFKKLIYKNLYPNIDVEYVCHPQTGIKYSLILHPGSDISKVKMKYPDVNNVSLKNGDVHIPTKFGDIIDHFPATFFLENKSSVILSRFSIQGNSISFQLDNYDKSKTVIIDPWVQTPTLANSNGVWECEKDGAGNVYIIGGDMPMKLLKYTSAGTIVWTYSTPYDTANNWLGTFAVDLAGNSYVTSGSIAALQKINTGGGMVYSVNGGSFDEYWNIAFNCDQTKLIIGGTRLVGFPSITGDGVIFDINTSNGSVTNMEIVGKSRTTIIFGSPMTVAEEVRSITSSRNAKYYFLTLDTIGAISQDFSACPDGNLFNINHTYAFAYKSEYYRPDNGNSGIMAIRANGNFVYSQNGITIDKRSLATGAILTSAPIPGGINTAGNGLNQPGNSGIDIDSCGNVYVGSGNAVLQYDSNLNVLNTVSTPFSIFDVAVSYGGDIIVCGATGNSSSISRTGYVQSINMSACDPMILFCCNATVCPTGPFCTTDAPVILTPATPGGVWSGIGITDSVNGTFDPSVAGAGEHTIVYTLGCGSDSITITVTCCGAEINPAGPFCVTDAPVTLTADSSGGTWSGTGITNASTGTFDPSVAGTGAHIIVYTISGCGSDSVTIAVNSCALIVCKETNGDLTASNGTAPYNWEEQTTTLDCSSCPFGICTPPICNGVNVTTWTSFGTTPTVTPPGTFPIRVSDNAGDTLVINSLSGLPNCSACSITLSLTSTPDSCGSSDGTATAIPSGGASPYTYSWNTSPVQTGYIATGLSAGTYTVIVTDSTGCADTASATVNSNSGTLSVSISQTGVSCNGGCDGTATANPSGGTLPYTYIWNDPCSQTTQTILFFCGCASAPGVYMVVVTDANGCSANSSVTLTDPTLLSVVANCNNVSAPGATDGSSSATPSGGTLPYAYLWSDGQTTGTATGLGAGTYTITVTDSNGCTATDSCTVAEPSCAITLALSSTPSACGGSDGSATVSASGGTTPYTYLWNDSATTAAATAANLPAGIYTVLVTDSNGCSQSDSVAVINTGGAALSITDSSMVSCKGGNDGSATLTASGGTLPYTYSWNTSPVQTGLTATGLTAGLYNVTVTDAAGCISIAGTTISEPDSIIVTLTNDTTICIGDSITISVSATGGTAPYVFTWDNGLGNGSTHTVSPALTTTYTVIVFDANLCPVAAQSVTVATNTPLSVTAFGTATICAGDSTILTANASGGDGGPYTYYWSNGAGSDSTVFVSPVNTTTYLVTVSDGCGSPYATDSVEITVNPELVLIPTSANICPGENAVLNVSGALTYWWAEESSPSDTIATGTTITVSPAITTTYLVTGFDGVCEKTAPVSVFVNPTPVADFGFNPLEAGIINPAFNFEDMSSAYIVSWLWYFGDGDTSAVENPTHTYSDTGTYLVMLIISDSLGCTDTVTKTVTVRGEYFLFAPNSFIPNSDGKNDVFIPKGIGIDEKNFEMYIYDRWGDEIFKTTDLSKGWDGRANNGKDIAQQDVYVWLILTKDAQGKRHRYIGHVTLLH